MLIGLSVFRYYNQLIQTYLSLENSDFKSEVSTSVLVNPSTYINGNYALAS